MPPLSRVSWSGRSLFRGWRRGEKEEIEAGHTLLGHERNLLGLLSTAKSPLVVKVGGVGVVKLVAFTSLAHDTSLPHTLWAAGGRGFFLMRTCS